MLLTESYADHAPAGECSHERARLVCDPNVGRWCLECPDCGLEACHADTPDGVRDNLAALAIAERREFELELLEVLMLWRLSRHGDADARTALEAALA